MPSLCHRLSCFQVKIDIVVLLQSFPMMISNKRKYCLDDAFSMWEEQKGKQGVSYTINNIYVHKCMHSYAHGKDWVGEEVSIFNWEQCLSKWSKYSSTCVCVVYVCVLTVGTTLWIHQYVIDNGVVSLNLSNANGLDIANIIIASPYLHIVIVPIVYSFYVHYNLFLF